MMAQSTAPFEDAKPRRRPGTGGGADREFMTLIALGVAGAMILGLTLFAFAIDKDHLPQNARTNHPSDEIAGSKGRQPPFGLAGVQLGMTPAEAGSVYPDMRLATARDGGESGFFRRGKGVYKVSFSSPSGGRRAYRIRYDETFGSFANGDLFQRLVRKFGEPRKSRCATNAGGNGERCEFHWTRPDGVAIEAVTQTVDSLNRGPRTILKLIVLDPSIKKRNTPYGNHFQAISAAASGRGQVFQRTNWWHGG